MVNYGVRSMLLAAGVDVGCVDAGGVDVAAGG